MTASDGQWRVTRRKWQQPIKNCCHFIVIGCHTYFVGGLLAEILRARAPSEADLGYRPRHRRISVRQGQPCLTDIRRSVGSYCCVGFLPPPSLPTDGVHLVPTTLISSIRIVHAFVGLCLNIKVSDVPVPEIFAFRSVHLPLVIAPSVIKAVSAPPSIV